MMWRAKLLLSVLLIGACCKVQSAPVYYVPPEYTDCTLAPNTPLTPPRPRTVKNIIDWANRTSRILIITQGDLLECRRKLLHVNALFEGVQELRQQQTQASGGKAP